MLIVETSADAVFLYNAIAHGNEDGVAGLEVCQSLSILFLAVDKTLAGKAQDVQLYTVEAMY
jgi:hypothetical protein